MAKEQKSVITTLVQAKVCKSCIRFGSNDQDEKVTTSLYLQNAAFTALGSPKEITVTVSAA